MRRRLAIRLVPSLIVALAMASPSRAQGPAEAKGRPVADLMRYEPTGLSLLTPYARGKIPVVFVHGLWSSPWSWNRMIMDLEAEPGFAERFQAWTFGYSTGDPIPYSASLLRHDLQEVRRKFDPEGSDAAFGRMVIVGHSMGGLLTKMMVQDSGDRLWRLLSERPFDALAGEPADREFFRNALVFEARPEVRRVVFIATPHRGSRVDRGSLQRLGTRLVRLADPLQASFGRLIARNGPDFFQPYVRRGLPTSIEELEVGSPMLRGLEELKVVPAVKVHSIIADRRNPPAAGGTDGLVPYDSAHVEGAVSEALVSSGHLCQENPAVIREVRRILLEHGTP